MKEINKVSTGLISFGYDSNYKAVYEKISPYLNEEEAEWLKHATREV